MNSVEIGPFRPHPFLWSGHSQTVLAALVSGASGDLLATTQHCVELPDGDQLVLHDDAAEGWQPGDRVALLVHGMCGSAESSYMQRISRKLTANGLRTFRLNLRGCGAGAGMARLPYHAGRSDDLQAAAEKINELTSGSSLVVAGFSLGGSLLLKWLGEQSESISPHVTRAMAVNPPVNLEACTNQVRLVGGGLYDRHFARLLCRHAYGTPLWRDQTPLSRVTRRPRRIVDFDELFTAPLAGYENARHYYTECSAAPFIPYINVPTLILSAQDDPLIPPKTLERLKRPECVRLHIAEGGGHLGYIGRPGNDPDRYWMDWRVVEWLTTQELAVSAA